MEGLSWVSFWVVLTGVWMSFVRNGFGRWIRWIGEDFAWKGKRGRGTWIEEGRLTPAGMVQDWYFMGEWLFMRGSGQIRWLRFCGNDS